MAVLQNRYRTLTDDTTDEEIPSEEDTEPLSRATRIVSRPSFITNSHIKKYLFCQFKHRDKCTTIAFSLLTLGFALIMMTLIYVYGFAFNHESDTLNSHSPNSYLNRCDSSFVDNEIITPAIDKRKYSFIQLANGLKVLIVSDPTTKISAASLTVLSGSYNDGPIPGLAHFCEHMLFLGNKKYPIPDSFITYISERGGTTNAYTDFGITNFHFDVDSDVFVQAIDMFANFFLNPLFLNKYVEKEINAVNSEFELDKLSNQWRYFRLLQILSNASHPFHRFNIGNTETLNISNIQNYLSQYFLERFSSNLMTLVLYGRENVSQMSSLANFSFGHLPNKEIFHETHPQPYNFLPKFIFARSLVEGNTINLVFQLPSFEIFSEQSPEFLVYLINFSGEKSFINYMKQIELVYDIYVEIHNLVDYTLLQVTISVEDNWISQCRWNSIIQLFFTYIYQLKNIDADSMESIFLSWAKVRQIKFDYELTGSDNALSLVSHLARQIQFINTPRNFLLPPCSSIFNYTFMYNELIMKLNTYNVLVVIYSSMFNLSIYNERNYSINSDEYFGINYAIVPITAVNISNWNGVTSHPFGLPGNLLIPNELFIYSSSEVDFIPDLSIHDNLAIWHLQNSKFSLPYAKFSCSLEVASKFSDLHYFTTLQLFKFIFDAIFPNEIYEFRDFYTVSISVSSTYSGLSIHLGGFSDEKLFQDFVHATIDKLTDQDLFTKNYSYYIGYNMLKDTLTNFFTESLAASLVMDTFKLLFLPNAFRINDIIHELENMTTVSFVQSLTELYINSYLTCFSFGNIEKSYSIQIGERIREKFRSESFTTPISQKFTHLCKGHNYTIYQKNNNSNDNNSVIDIVYQLGPICGITSIGDKCNYDLLQKFVVLKLIISIMSSSFFNVLRTEEQLGYLVQAFISSESDEFFLHFLIQSPDYGPDYLEGRIDNFLLNFNVTLNSFSEDYWRSIINLFNESIQVEPNSFNGAYERVWSEINTKQFQFSRNAQIKEIISTISIFSVISYFRTIFFDDPAPRINFKLYPSYIQPKCSNNSEYIDYESIEKFKMNVVC